MNEEELLKKWYALFVMTGEEDKVKDRLNHRFSDTLQILVPKRKLRVRKGAIWHIDTKVLFPGYVLVRGDMDYATYYRFKNVPGLIRVLRSGLELTEIAGQEISVLSRLICNSEVIGFSTILKENSRIRVIDGPLFAMEGIILAINPRKHRAKILLNFLGEERTVDVGISVIQPMEYGEVM